MMKRTLFILTLALVGLSAKAQVTQWLVPPVYDNVEIPVGANIVFADSANCSVVYSRDGRRLLTTSDVVFPFSDGFFVTTTPYDAKLTGVYDANGLPIEYEKVQLGWGYPKYHDGYLLVHDGYYFYYMDGTGIVNNTRYVKAYPFSCGFASVFNYGNLRKKKDPYCLLIDTTLQPISLVLEGKPVGQDDVDFISSVSDEGLGVISIKHKLYHFEAATKTLRPLYANADDEAAGRNQAKVDGDWLTQTEDSASVRAKCGSTGELLISMDAMLKPVAFTSGGQRRAVKSKERPSIDAPSPLKGVKADDGKIALWRNDQQLLPAQFDEILHRFGDDAMVKFNGKFGLLRVHPNDQLKLSLNKGNPIAFRHKRFDTQLRLDVPSYVNSAATTIYMNDGTGCDIDKISKDTRNSTAGNYVQYDCVLQVPADITSDKVTELSYPLYVVHEGLRTLPLAVKADAWHYVYYNVDIRESSISKGSLNFTSEISAERLVGEDIYPYTIQLVTQGLHWELVEKVSETRYKWRVDGLREGNNVIKVQLLEEGVPPMDYTFELEYSRQSSGKQVEMRKKLNEHMKTKPVQKKEVKHLGV